MGAVLGSVVKSPVLWAGSGRSQESIRRAEAAGFEDAGMLDRLVERSEIIISVCPPAAAEQVASEVEAAGFAGIYLDANAVAPATARRISGRFARFVDGGIVGPPPSAPGLTRLYVSGQEATAIADLFAETAVEVRVVDGGPGAASAVKMCYAGWTKATSALLLAIRALADAEGVTDAIVGEWATSIPELVDRSEAVSGQVGPKAWRFEGEMMEIAATFAEQDLPPHFHQGAAEIYRRLAELKGTTSPTLDEALGLLRH